MTVVWNILKEMYTRMSKARNLNKSEEKEGV